MTSPKIATDPSELSSHYAAALQAFFECSGTAQQIVKDMLEIIGDTSAEEDEKRMALLTLHDALFPQPHKRQHGMDLADSESEAAEIHDELRTLVAEFDREEATFGDRLERALEKAALTQTELAEKIGVTQAAISMMINRQCRPQRRTVRKISEALGLSPETLWPTSFS